MVARVVHTRGNRKIGLNKFYYVYWYHTVTGHITFTKHKWCNRVQCSDVMEKCGWFEFYQSRTFKENEEEREI